MILNNYYFAPTRAGMLDTLFNPVNGRTAHGYYKKQKHGVMLYNMQSDCFAFICTHETTPFIVTASKLDNGKYWYMYALSDVDSKYLGLDQLGYTEKHNAIVGALESIKQA